MSEDVNEYYFRPVILGVGGFPFLARAMVVSYAERLDHGN